MTNAEYIKKFASDLKEVLPVIINAAQENNKALDMLTKKANSVNINKEASAPVLDDARLYKAANAVASSNLNTHKITAQNYYEVFKGNPNAVLDCLTKVASINVGAVVKQDIGRIVSGSLNKKASATDKANASSSFLAYFNN